MTRIDVHVNVDDQLLYACRLLRKATGSGARIVVTGTPECLEKLDTLLWTFSETDFIAHCRDSAPADMVALSPVLLADDAQAQDVRDVLLNLGANVVPGFERFARLIEVADTSGPQLEAARRRWKHYRERGYPLERHGPAASVGPGAAG